MKNLVSEWSTINCTVRWKYICIVENIEFTFRYLEIIFSFKFSHFFSWEIQTSIYIPTGTFIWNMIWLPFLSEHIWRDIMRHILRMGAYFNWGRKFISLELYYMFEWINESTRSRSWCWEKWYLRVTWIFRDMCTEFEGRFDIFISLIRDWLGKLIFSNFFWEIRCEFVLNTSIQVMCISEFSDSFRNQMIQQHIAKSCFWSHSFLFSKNLRQCFYIRKWYQ